MSKKSLLASMLAVLGTTFCYMACSGDTSVAGGVSEETNTLAGVLVDGSGNSVARAIVSARHFENSSCVSNDTTDEKGRFALALTAQGRYGISAQTEKASFYKMVEFNGQSDSIVAKLSPVGKIAGVLKFSNDSVAAAMEISVPGSPWMATTDSEGKFSLDKVPQGTHPLIAKSPDPIQYVDAVYMANVSGDSAVLYGPVPSAALSSSRQFAASKVVYFPVSTEYGLRSWWSMDYLTAAKNNLNTIGDSRGGSESMLVYGSSTLSEGIDGHSLTLNGAGQYGVVENDRGLLDSASSMFLEAWVRVNSVSSEVKSYRKNIVGKVGFGSEEDRDVFSLAVVNGNCGAGAASFAFFMADGSGDTLSCQNAVVAPKPLALKKWTYVAAVWNGDELRLYIDGQAVARKKISVKKIGISDEPIFFGKESMDLDLDDVRIGVTALGDADVVYRFNLKEVQDDGTDE